MTSKHKFFSFTLLVDGKELIHNIVSSAKELATSYVLEIYENHNVNIIDVREEHVHNLIVSLGAR
jgi:hypothetical protein